MSTYITLTRIKKCLDAGMVWEYKHGILVFKDGAFKSVLVIGNESSDVQEDIFKILGIPNDYGNYSCQQASGAETELYRKAVLPVPSIARNIPFKSSLKGLESRSKLIQKYTIALSVLDDKYVLKHKAKVMAALSELIKYDYSQMNEHDVMTGTLVKVVRKYFSSAIKLDKDAGYDLSLEAFITSLKNYN